MKQRKGTAQLALGSHPVSDTAALVVEEQHEHWWKATTNKANGSSQAAQMVPTIDTDLLGGGEGILSEDPRACGGTGIQIEQEKNTTERMDST